MDFKDQWPIKFEILQSDMEKIMAVMEAAVNSLDKLNMPKEAYDLRRVKEELQHKIDKHIERKDWV